MYSLVFVSDSNSWEKILSQGPGPGCLQGHSMVEHQDVLYVFGGELSFCNDQETPLWMYDIKVITGHQGGDCTGKRWIVITIAMWWLCL